MKTHLRWLLLFVLSLNLGWTPLLVHSAETAASSRGGSSQPAVEGGFYEDGQLKRVSAIKILPYDPLSNIKGDKTPHKIDEEDSANHGLFTFPAPTVEGIPVGKYRDGFGYTDPKISNRNFTYLNEDEIGKGEFTWIPHEGDTPGHYKPGTHGDYLQRLLQYKEKIAPIDSKKNKIGENLLLTRIKIDLVGQDKDKPVNSYDYFFGVFVSGSADYTSSPDSLSLAINPKEKDKSRGNEILKEVESQKIDLEKAFEQAFKRKYGEQIAGTALYDKPTFEVNRGRGIRLGPLTMEKRVKDIKDGLVLLQHRFEPLMDPRITILTSLHEAKSIKEKRGQFLSYLFGPNLLSTVLADPMGVIGYLDNGDLAGLSALQTIFHQSEQAFLSYFHANGFENKGNHFFPSKIEKGSHTCQGITIYLYSTTDVCRYCRGTLSYSLVSDKLLTEIILKFKALSIILLPPYPKKDININVNAFSSYEAGI